jgi:hypothetical protein
MTTTMRAPLAPIIALAAILLAPAIARAQDDDAPGPNAPSTEGMITSTTDVPLQDEITAEASASIARGLRALAASQVEDGSVPSERLEKHAGITALACLAFMADGNVPGRGPYGEHVRKGLEFVLSSVNPTGLIASETSHGPMYGHGFATLFLGEVYGMTQGGGDSALSARIHDALVRACRLIVNTQNDEGGWRYNPVPQDADISVTICQIMALRSARNAGIEIPKATIDRAVEYVRQCQNTDGGFRYQLNRGGSAWPRSAAGVASLYYAGIYEGDDIHKGLDYLVQSALPGETNPSKSHYAYGHYYAAQAMFLAGGDYWARWWPAIRAELIATQDAEGMWDGNYGRPYSTAMSLIVLQMPKRYLPIFQK